MARTSPSAALRLRAATASGTPDAISANVSLLGRPVPPLLPGLPTLSQPPLRPGMVFTTVFSLSVFVSDKVLVPDGVLDGPG